MAKHSDLLIEIGTEELPPTSLAALSKALVANFTEQLVEYKLSFIDIQKFATPRRLAFRVNGLSCSQQDSTVIKKGPSLQAAYDPQGNPSKAAMGFAKSVGVTVAELEKVETAKGSWLQYKQHVPGKMTEQIIPQILQLAVQKLPIKRTMRWGANKYSFVRPVHWLIVLFGNKVIETSLFGVNAGNVSYGHRFLQKKVITIKTPASYEKKLLQAQVIANYSQRQQKILDELQQQAKKLSAEIIIEPDLLNEVTAMVEFPVVLTGSFDLSFLQLPQECLISAICGHQRGFPLTKDNKLFNKFLLVSNMPINDCRNIIAGNEKVMVARLQDAAFHYNSDLRNNLDTFLPKLQKVVFQKDLGSLYDKAKRVQKVAVLIAEKLAVNPELVARAALLSKADLLSQMVLEFPELQGIMGYYYALAQNEPNEVALAIKEQYLPKAADDLVPTSLIGVCLALADRLDNLFCLFAKGKQPTGDKDPFSLRRQALAVIRILIEKQLFLDLAKLIGFVKEAYNDNSHDPTKQLLGFCFERMKSWCLSKQFSAKSYAAVIASQVTLPFDIYLRMQAVTSFTKLSQATSLAAANKRVSNLLAKANSHNLDFSAELLELDAEKELFAAIENQYQNTAKLYAQQDYTQLLQNLAGLKPVVDNFFDNVMVMVDDPKLRNNRLGLLAKLRGLFLQVADISLL